VRLGDGAARCGGPLERAISAAAGQAPDDVLRQAEAPLHAAAQGIVATGSPGLRPIQAHAPLHLLAGGRTNRAPRHIEWPRVGAGREASQADQLVAPDELSGPVRRGWIGEVSWSCEIACELHGAGGVDESRALREPVV